MKLGGWMRFYVVVVVVTGAASLALWTASKPGGPNDGHYASACEADFTQHSAQHYLVTNPITSTLCYRQITAIANGDEDRARHDRWMHGFRIGATIWAAAMAILYAIGWAIGWIWRGFFPAR